MRLLRLAHIGQGVFLSQRSSDKEFQGEAYNDSLECPGDSKKLKPTKSAKKEKRYETRLRHQRQTVFRQELSVRVPADDRNHGGNFARSHDRKRHGA